MELYAVKYGESLFPEKYVYHDKSASNEKVDFVWLFYVMKLGNKTILIDTGFHDTYLVKHWGIDFMPFEPELNSLIGGFTAVDYVFITHRHFDHVGNVHRCTKATFIIAEKELELLLEQGDSSIKQHLSTCKLIKVIDEYQYEQQLLFKVIGGHSEGSSVIYFSEGDSDYIITGDECYLSNNLYQKRPVGTFTNYENNLKFLTNAYDKSMIPLPMHEPGIFTNYERVGEYIVRII